MLIGSDRLDPSGTFYGQPMQGVIGFQHPAQAFQAQPLLPGQPPLPGHTSMAQYNQPMLAGPQPVPMQAPNGGVQQAWLGSGVQHVSRDVAVDVQRAQLTSPTSELVNKELIQEIMKPGFTDHVSHEQTLSTVRELAGEMDCYVTLQDVTVSGQVDLSHEEYPTVGNTIFSIFRSLVGGKKATSARVLLNDVTTAFEPGKLCLLLGPPSSGKSSLLKYTSGRLDPSLDKSEGKLRFNGVEVEAQQLPRIALYIPQVDEHCPVLTVQDTLNFSHDCQLSNWMKMHVQKLGLDLTQFKHPRPKVEMMMHLYGLKNCKDTIVGDGTHRGVSGGEKKRVTSGELIQGPQMVLCQDEISTGLDSAATYDITKSARTACHTLKLTTIISLLQPPPEVFELFDDVLIMAPGGHVIYHGPVSTVRKYFAEELGFACPDSVDFADFLVDICTDDAKVYYKPCMHFGVIPPTPVEMGARWKRSEIFRDYISPRFDKARAQGNNAAENKINQAPWTWEFGSSYGTMFTLNLMRHLRILSKDTAFIRQRIMQGVIQGVMLGTIFYQEENPALKVSMLFVFLALLSMGNMYIIDVAVAKRAVFYKHRDSALYPTICYTAAEFVSEIPLVLLECLVIGCLAFFLIGFTYKTFVAFFFAIFLTNISFLSLFKAIVANMPTASAAQGIAIGIMAVTFCFSGFLVAEQNIPDYFIWIYWITPYSWLLRLLCCNEFMSSGNDGEWDIMVPLPTGPVRQGNLILQSFSIQTGSEWVGWGFLYLVCLLVLSQLTYTLGLHYRRLGSTRPMVVVHRKGKTLPQKLHDLAHSHHGPKSPTAALQRTPSLDNKGEGGPTIDPFEVMARHSPDAVTVSLKDLGYKVKVPAEGGKGTEWKPLLNNINAIFKPGTMTALMGSSGAGKSTLMDVIAGRKTGGDISGAILLNGHPQEMRPFSQVSGYVEQTDIHVPTQTVLEALRFSAWHRLPRDKTDLEKEEIVSAVIELVELRPILDKIIGQPGAGGSGTGLSVEQRKRVTIGVEMAANPTVLFLDEPTSGLDSRSARVVMRAVKRIAKSGRTVLCTIHQPSFEIFSMFDNLLLLKKGGWMVYNGGLGPAQPNEVTGEEHNSARDLVQYFQSCSPTIAPPKPGKNPAEYMLETIGAGTSAGNASGGVNPTGVDFVEAYKSSQMARATEGELNSLQTGTKIVSKHAFSASFPTQLWWSVKRWTTSYWRNVGYNLTRLVVVIVVALLFSLNVVKERISEIKDQPTLQSFNGAIFAGVFFTSAVQAVMTVTIIGDNKVVYYRERAAGMYTPIAYVFGLTIAEVPWLLAVTFFHSVIFYPIAHLHEEADYVAHYVLSVFLFATLFCYWGQMLSALLPTTEMASLLTGASMGIMNLYSGFFMPESAIPWPWKLLFYISPARFGLKAAMPRQFYCSLSCFLDQRAGVDLEFDCNNPNTPINTLAAAPYNGEGPGCSLMLDRTGYVVAKLGAEEAAQKLGLRPDPATGTIPPYFVTVWDYFSITTESTEEHVWDFTLSMVGFLAGFKLITLLALTFLKHINR